MPYWVDHLLRDAKHFDVDRFTAQITERLGLANLLGWWSYLIQDWLLDRDRDQPELLAVGIAFFTAWIRVLERLLPGIEPFWSAFETLSMATAEAHCWEQQRHFWNRADIDDHALDFDDLDRLVVRSALLQLSTVGQFILHGYADDDPRCIAVREMVHHYTIGRQVSDDRTDWADDLQNGHLNLVSAGIMRRMKEARAVERYAELDVDRMMGHHLHDDVLFEIQHTILEHFQRAKQSITPYGARYLGALVDELAERTESGYQDALNVRRRLQNLFMLP